MKIYAFITVALLMAAFVMVCGAEAFPPLYLYSALTAIAAYFTAGRIED